MRSTKRESHTSTYDFVKKFKDKDGNVKNISTSGATNQQATGNVGSGKNIKPKILEKYDYPMTKK